MVKRKKLPYNSHNLPRDSLNRTYVHVQMYKRRLTTTAASNCGAERQTSDHILFHFQIYDLTMKIWAIITA